MPSRHTTPAAIVEINRAFTSGNGEEMLRAVGGSSEYFASKVALGKRDEQSLQEVLSDLGNRLVHRTRPTENGISLAAQQELHLQGHAGLVLASALVGRNRRIDAETVFRLCLPKLLLADYALEPSKGDSLPPYDRRIVVWSELHLKPSSSFVVANERAALRAAENLDADKLSSASGVMRVFRAVSEAVAEAYGVTSRNLSWKPLRESPAMVDGFDGDMVLNSRFRDAMNDPANRNGIIWVAAYQARQAVVGDLLRPLYAQTELGREPRIGDFPDRDISQYLDLAKLKNGIEAFRHWGGPGRGMHDRDAQSFSDSLCTALGVKTPVMTLDFPTKLARDSGFHGLGGSWGGLHIKAPWAEGWEEAAGDGLAE